MGAKATDAEVDLRRTRDERGRRMSLVRPDFLEAVRTSYGRRHIESAVTEDSVRSLEAEMAEFLDLALLGTRMKEEALRRLLDYGRFRVQAEVGSRNPARPPELERSIWTIDTLDLGDLPVYGYAATEGDVLDLDGGNLSRLSLRNTYGSARVIFRDEIRARTTFAVHDSLSRLQHRTVAPSAVTSPSYLSWPADGDVDRETLGHGAADEFVELQILGRVYIEDIERVVFDSDPDPKTLEALEDHGVPSSLRVDHATSVPWWESPGLSSPTEPS